MTITNQRINITHSDADTMSIAKGVGAYSDASSSEIAFFLKGEWVVPPIEYFAAYHDGFTTTTAVLLTYPVAEAVKVTEESASTTSSNGA